MMNDVHIQGDDIYFRGQMVARFTNCHATLRDRAEHALSGEGAAYEIAALKEEVRRLEEELQAQEADEDEC